MEEKPTNIFAKARKLYAEKKAVKYSVNILVLAAVLVCGLAIGGFFNKAPDDEKTKIADGVEYAEDKDYSDVEDKDNISIPGYDTFTFEAGKKEQEVTLFNPEENTCYFKMSLILEDGTVIWTSDLLEPGKAFQKIVLDKALDKGAYKDVLLKYDCFSLKDRSQLNGAEIKVDIEVK